MTSVILPLNKLEIEQVCFLDLLKNGDCAVIGPGTLEMQYILDSPSHIPQSIQSTARQDL